MPRIGGSIQNCVFFLYGTHWKTGERIGPGGTGVFVARRSKLNPNLVHFYAVSNRHVVQQFSDIRINDGTITQIVEIDPTKWVYSKDEDLAAVDVSDLMPKLKTDANGLQSVRYNLEDNFYEPQSFRPPVWLGDPTFMMGLFADHVSPNKNIPVARFGNIAAMPSAEAPISLSLTDTFKRPAFLNDMRSRAGFSGSPVWTWFNPYDDMNNMELYGVNPAQTIAPNKKRAWVTFLGLHRGQLRERTTIFGIESAGIKDGSEIEIASAMTVVIPAYEISRLLDYQEFENQRNARDERPERQKFAQENSKLVRENERFITE